MEYIFLIELLFLMVSININKWFCSFDIELGYIQAILSFQIYRRISEVLLLRVLSTYSEDQSVRLSEGECIRK
jgi:hypothetical protein